MGVQTQINRIQNEVNDQTNLIGQIRTALADKTTLSKHASTHATGGSDPITPASIGAKAADESDVFIATYGTTTNAEIEAAYQAGKAVYCLDKSTTPSGFYSLTRISTSGHYANFDVAIGQDLSGIGLGETVQAIRISCTQGTWSTTKYAAATSEHASAHASDGTDPITPASIGAAPISTTTEVTLAAASWSGDSAPYTYTLTVNGVTDTSTQEIVFATSINLEQLTAGQNANIQDGGQSANTIVLKAWGEKPTVDLPIRVIMRG